MKDDNKKLQLADPEHRGFHRVLFAVAAFFYVYLVLEGAFLVPFMLQRYGLHY